MVVPLSKILARASKANQASIENNDNLISDLETSLDSGSTKLSDLQSCINGCYRTVFSLSGRLSDIQRSLTTASNIANVINITITTITLLPIPTTPFVTVGLITTFAQKLVKLNEIITGVKSLVSQLTPIISSQLSQLSAQKTRLDALTDRIMSALQKAGVADQFTFDEENYRQLDFSIGEYNEYKFYLKEEKVGTLLRHYAIAVKDSREYYRTDKSFTLNPSVLTDQLIAQIKTKENESINI